MTFDDAFIALIGNEGGYSNDPADPGGETMWGITARVARDWGYTGDMRLLPQPTAKVIAHDKYWVPAHCDDLPETMRFEAFDSAYNMGVHEAIVIIQRALGVEADGVFGAVTSAAMVGHPPESLRRKFTAERLRFYTNLPGWEHDGRGWANRIADNLMKD